jgi:hypothetical protein
MKRAKPFTLHWDMTTLSLEMTGAERFCSRGIGVRKHKENHQEFHRVPDDLTLTQAADILN